MAIRTVRELLQELEGLDPETPILCAEQPTYPLQFNLRAVVAYDRANERSENGDDDFCGECGCTIMRRYPHGSGDGRWFGECVNGHKDEIDPPEAAKPVVYLVLGDHPYNESAYAPRAIFN